ncbi:cell division protein FtsA [Patescibacteria group bacterium]|nr:cell division protein FtsA [Patescibacteria group bacterium]
MPRPYIITALDIGSGSIKLLTVSKKPGEADFEILSYNQQASLGIRKGVVIDVPKVAEIVSSLKEKAEQDCGRRIDNVYASIGGGHIFCTSSRGLVSVSRADQKISEEDIARVLQAAQAISLPSNKEIIEVFPKEFIVDGEGGVREAIGMEGVRLEAETLILCGFSPYLKNSSQSILNSGFQINYLFPDPLASARAVLTPREKELGVCVLDIGAGTTGLAVFEEGNLIHTAVFPIGSGHITGDIAICLKTDIDTAEKIKLEFGSCLASSKEKKKIKIEQEEPLIFSKKALADIIEARVSEIFAISNKELKKISRQRLLPAGVVLTGGGAKLPGIRELTKKELKLPCRIGVSQVSPAFQEDPSLSTLYGLILEGVDSEEEQGNFPSSRKGIKNKLKKIFRVFIP